MIKAGNRPGSRVEDVAPSRSALRRQQFQERLQTERVLGEEAQLRSRERDGARLAEMREQQLREARLLQIQEQAQLQTREEQRLTEERRAAAESRATRASLLAATEVKVAQRALRQPISTSEQAPQEKFVKSSAVVSGTEGVKAGVARGLVTGVDRNRRSAPERKAAANIRNGMDSQAVTARRDNTRHNEPLQSKARPNKPLKSEERDTASASVQSPSAQELLPQQRESRRVRAKEEAHPAEAKGDVVAVELVKPAKKRAEIEQPESSRKIGMRQAHVERRSDPIVGRQTEQKKSSKLERPVKGTSEKRGMANRVPGPFQREAVSSNRPDRAVAESRARDSAAGANAKARNREAMERLRKTGAASVSTVIMPAASAEAPQSKRTRVIKPVPAKIPMGSGSGRISRVSSVVRMMQAARDVAAQANASGSVPSAPALQVRGSFLVNANGDAVHLRGVTVRGLDSVATPPGQAFAGALALDPANLAAITRQWKANLVRLPFSAGTILSGNGTLSASDLLVGLDLVVASVTETGTYVLLALEDSTGRPSDANVAQVWQTLCQRYQGDPLVFYELFASSTTLSAASLTEMVALVNTVRALDPAALLFVNAGSGGVNSSAVPLNAGPGNPILNLVYTISVTAENLGDPNQLSGISSSYPLFASVWSDDGSDLGRSASRIGDFFGRCGIGWAAANWNADPRIVNDAAKEDFTPTMWGNVVQAAASALAPPLWDPSDARTSLSTLLTGPMKVSRLTTTGNAIVDEQGNAVALRGVTAAGLDTLALGFGQSLPAAMGLDGDNVNLLTATLGFNLVRIPFQAQTVLSGNGALAAGSVLAGLDVVVALLSEAGLYTMLALEASTGVAAAPDTSTLQVWQMLGYRYKDSPGVLYEVFSSTQPLAPNWLQSALALMAAVREQSGAALIFVGSGNGATDVSGLPVLLPTGDPIPNVVYTVSVSPETLPGPDDGPLGVFADKNPVFVSVWSDDANTPSRLSPNAGDFFGRHNMGFAAANWNADPRLIVDAVGHNFTSTAWGSIVARAARLPVQPVLQPFL